jgi:hypothetical protein
MKNQTQQSQPSRHPEPAYFQSGLHLRDLAAEVQRILEGQPCIAKYLATAGASEISIDQFLACLYFEENYQSEMTEVTEQTLADTEAAVRAELASANFATTESARHSEFLKETIENFGTAGIIPTPSDASESIIRFLTIMKYDHGRSRALAPGDAAVWNLVVEDRPDLTELKQHLLRQAGKGFQRNDFIALQIPRRLSKRLLSNGEFLSGKDVELVPMERNTCHENAEELADDTGAEHWIGFALNGEIWRVHSWCLEDEKILETTLKQDLYFGVPISRTFTKFVCQAAALARHIKSEAAKKQ